MFSRLFNYFHVLFSSGQYPTVRYAFSLLFLLAAFAGVAAVVTNDGSYVRIEVPTITIDKGSQFAVDVYVYASAPVNAVDIAVNFPSEFVEVLGVDRGESVVTLWTQDPYVDNGAVILQGGTYRKGFIGDHKIATINLRATASGKAEFLVRDAILLAGDGKGTPLAVSNKSLVTSLYIYPEGEQVDSIQAETTLVLVTDLNSDGVITLGDISAFMASWYGTGPQRDFNNDGRMTFRDFSIILAVYFSQ